MQSPVLERLVGGAVLVGLLLLLALVVGPRDGVRMPNEEGSESPVASDTLQPAESLVVVMADEDSRNAEQIPVPDRIIREAVRATAAGSSRPGSSPPPRAGGPVVVLGPEKQAPREPAAETAPQTEPPPSARASSGGPQWGVQVGSFAERGNAERFSEGLSGWRREQGYGVKIVPAAQQGKTLYRVQVGPFANRDGARAAVAQLALQGRRAFVTDWSGETP